MTNKDQPPQRTTNREEEEEEEEGEEGQGRDRRSRRTYDSPLAPCRRRQWRRRYQRHRKRSRRREKTSSESSPPSSPPCCTGFFFSFFLFIAFVCVFRRKTGEGEQRKRRKSNDPTKAVPALPNHVFFVLLPCPPQHFLTRQQPATTYSTKKYHSCEKLCT